VVEPRNGDSGAVADSTALGRFLREHEAAVSKRLPSGRDQSRIVVELVITRVPVDGPALFTGNLRDITDQKQVAEEQARLHHQAEEAGRMRERLLAIVAHDLRNPFAAALTGATLLLKSGAAAEDAALIRRADTILRACSRMDRLIADLLDTANIHRGHLSIQRQLTRLSGIISDAVEGHQPAAAAKDIQLTVRADIGEVECSCDRDRILQVLSNLIGNAVKFCRRGDSIQVRAAVADGGAHIEVADTGPGIAAGDLPRIFDPYWSSHRGVYDAAERSTGLGLFISKGIVEAHGGRLSAESEPGRGSTFRLTLPLEPLGPCSRPCATRRTRHGGFGACGSGLRRLH
jgi:signal transduction histidine kinase